MPQLHIRVELFSRWNNEMTVASDVNAFLETLEPWQQAAVTTSLSTSPNNQHEGCYYTVLVTYPIASNDDTAPSTPSDGAGG